jgi:hypothetical protein
MFPIRLRFFLLITAKALRFLPSERTASRSSPYVI